METRQFAKAAKVFSKLEKKASTEKKFQPNGRISEYITIASIALGKLGEIGEERLFQIRINGHLPIGKTALGIAKKFMNNYAVIRAGKRMIYEEGTYDALACVCEAAKELGDYGY